MSTKKNWFDECGKAYSEFRESPRLPLWTRIRLWFKPAYVALNWAGDTGGSRVILIYKWLDGRCYIIREETFDGFNL
jgi:hypothetical protein